jgi:uncharacterized membrane protein
MKTKTTHILWWIIGLLVVLNITTVITIMYHSGHVPAGVIADRPDIEKTAQPQRNAWGGSGAAGFSKEQKALFRKSNRAFRQKTRRIIENINAHKQEMYTELCSAQPDTTRLRQLSAEIGTLHKELKDATINFYFALCMECKTREEKERLGQWFWPFFRQEGPPLKRKAKMHQRRRDTLFHTQDPQ